MVFFPKIIKGIYNKELIVKETDKLNDVSTNANNFYFLNDKNEVFRLLYEENTMLF